MNIRTIILEEVIRQQLFEQGDLEKLKKKKAELEAEKKEADSIGDSRKATKLKQEIVEIDKQIAAAEKAAREVTPKPKPDASDDSSSNTDTGKTKTVPRPEDYNGKNGTESKNNLKSGKINGYNIKLEAEAYDAFMNMYGAMPSDLKKKISSVYTWRTYATQYSIVDWSMVKNADGPWRKIDSDGSVVVAKPGTSNHGLGLAIDIEPRDVQEWIKANGEKYGWSWDEGKSVKEDWHFTYDGEIVNPPDEEWNWTDFIPTTWTQVLVTGVLVGVLVKFGLAKRLKTKGLKITGKSLSKLKVRQGVEMEKALIKAAKTPGAMTKLYQQFQAGTIGGMEKQLIKMIRRIETEGYITADEARIQIEWIKDNKATLAKYMERDVFDTAHRLYQEGQITIDELMQIYPAEMRNSAALRNTLTRTPKTLVPSDFSAEQLAKLKKSTNPLDAPLRKYDVLKPIELKAIPENEIQIGLKKLAGKTTPKDIVKIETKVRGQKRVMSAESSWNTSISNFVAKSHKIPEKWLTEFPKDLKQFRKEWQEFTGNEMIGVRLGERGIPGDKKTMSRYYYYIQLL